MSAKLLGRNLKISRVFAPMGRYARSTRFDASAFMVKHDEEAGHEWWRES